MGRYLFRRIINYLVMMFIATTLVYFLAASQLDPRLKYNWYDPNFNREAALAAFDDLNINPETPITTRYWTWLKDIVLHWDWGRTVTGGSVNEQVSSRIWVSFRLVTIGFFVGTAIGVAIGAWTATRQYKVSDKIFTVWSLITLSTPVVVIAVALQILATKFNRLTGWDWFEFLGETGQHSGSWISPFLDRMQHLLLPTITLVLINAALFSRYQRNLMLDTLNADYVRTARAKGLRWRDALLKHALRTALIPTATLFAFSVAGIFVGAVFTETLFGWHGMGEYLIVSINQQDVNSSVAVAAFTAVCVLVGAVLSEIFVVMLDPRVRVS